MWFAVGGFWSPGYGGWSYQSVLSRGRQFFINIALHFPCLERDLCVGYWSVLGSYLFRIWECWWRIAVWVVPRFCCSGLPWIIRVCSPAAGTSCLSCQIFAPNRLWCDSAGCFWGWVHCIGIEAVRSLPTIEHSPARASCISAWPSPALSLSRLALSLRLPLHFSWMTKSGEEKLWAMLIFRCTWLIFQPVVYQFFYSQMSLFAILLLTIHFSFALSASLSRALTHFPLLWFSSAPISFAGEARDSFRSGWDARTPNLFGLFAWSARRISHYLFF